MRLALFLLMVLASGSALALEGKNLLTGEPVQVQPGKNGTVVVFLSSHCPCSNSHIEILRHLAAEYKDFAFVGVHSNSDEKPAESKGYFQNAALPFPVLQDEHSRLANEFKASRTPHAFVLTTAGKTVYRGGVTDSSEASSAHKQYLQDALDDVRSGHPVRVSEARSLGCAIMR